MAIYELQILGITILLLYSHLVYLILKVLTWEIYNMKYEFAKQPIIKWQCQYGKLFYDSDFKSTFEVLNNFVFQWQHSFVRY